MGHFPLHIHILWFIFVAVVYLTTCTCYLYESTCMSAWMHTDIWTTFTVQSDAVQPGECHFTSAEYSLFLQLKPEMTSGWSSVWALQRRTRQSWHTVRCTAAICKLCLVAMKRKKHHAPVCWTISIFMVRWGFNSNGMCLKCKIYCIIYFNVGIGWGKHFTNTYFMLWNEVSSCLRFFLPVFSRCCSLGIMQWVEFSIILWGVGIIIYRPLSRLQQHTVQHRRLSCVTL